MYSIKEEPVEHNDNHDNNNFDLNKKSTEQKSFIDKQYEIDLPYLNHLNETLLNLNENNDEMDLFKDMLESSKTSFKINKNESQNSSYTKELIKMNKINLSKEFNNKNAFKKSKQEEQQNNEQMAFEKKRIINALVDSAKEKNNTNITNKNRLEPLSLNEEQKLLRILNKIFENLNQNETLRSSEFYAMKRMKCKLELRNLKRNLNLPIFDCDSYTNELIDSERLAPKRNKIKSEFESTTQIPTSNFIEDDDIIFEQEILKTTLGEDNTDCEIIAVKNILDRFEDRNFKLNNYFHHQNQNFNIEKYDLNFQASIGLVESRDDDVKCVISPLTNKVLKPYIRRDYETIPIKLDLIQKINSKNEMKNFKSNPIDYVHLRPEHVQPINTMLRLNFWNGIDISECLEYTDYTIVALYGKLIIGFAFMVPNEAQNQAYLSFIYVHPDWRNLKKCQEISIAQYMMFYLIQLCQNWDVSLHVSVNSPSVIFYQKFGFKIVEYIKNFYDKYYSSETSNLSKDAFLMCLPKI